ncbi:MAG: AMP-binding protein, partial [Deltaproteobacteria bacterium]|nr:AMP-binding protein [Deltaproteobacteria bacterium]
HWTPLVVIYTSGTTGAPKGVPCTHMKLIGAGIVTNTRIHLKKSDRGYICMPLFHSNAWFIGILPLIMAGGSFFLKPRFSASAFEKDILEHGVTYMNYVGQPIHYILIALEKKHGGPEGVEKTLSHHPANRFRLAHGNGAPPVDREKLRRYLGMEHVYELYGSTEAAITTTNQPGDPIDSLGVVSSKKI